MSKLNLGQDLYLKGRIGWRGLSKDEYLTYSDYKIINATSLMDGFVDWDNCGFISKERYEESDEIMLKEGDILISKDGTLGKIGYVKNLTIPCTVASGVFVLRNTIPERLNFDYLYHVLKSPIFKDFIARNKATGSTIPHLYQRDLENFELELPSISEQGKIAFILNLIDTEIANNNAIAANLEAMVKLLYDYWFVQFDFPDENGRPYKSSGGKMIWNEELKRDCPEGWNALSLGELCTVISGYPFNSKTYDPSGQYSVLTIKNIQDGYVNPITESRICSLPRDIPKHDILKLGDILISLTGNVGRVGLLCGNRYLLNQRAAIVKPRNIDEKWYLYFLLRSRPIFSQIQNVATGTSQKNVSPIDIHKIKVPYNSQKCKMFTSLIDSFVNRIIECNKENIELISLRDFLLPMLMNGQVGFKSDF